MLLRLSLFYVQLIAFEEQQLPVDVGLLTSSVISLYDDEWHYIYSVVSIRQKKNKQKKNL